MKRGQLIPGVILIALGSAFLLMQYFDFGPGLFLTLLGLAFLVPYALTRLYGLLIPGCILAGLGIGMMVERGARMEMTVLLGLGLGFIAIYVIHLILTRNSHWWPLIPGGILIVIGIVEAVPQGQALFEKWWPLILIVIGLAVLAGPFLMSRNKDTSQ
jgi:hypothetical protein